MTNQVQIPSVKTSNDSMNQVQQNVNKVFRNINNQVVDIQHSLGELMILGEIKLAGLTLLQFQAIAGIGWILANGQSSVGTDYETLTNNKVVPNISVAGSTAFIKVNNG